jgi:hypothetical protein
MQIEDPELKEEADKFAKEADRKRKQDYDESVINLEQKLKMDRLRLAQMKKTNPTEPPAKKGWFS